MSQIRNEAVSGWRVLLELSETDEQCDLSPNEEELIHEEYYNHVV